MNYHVVLTIAAARQVLKLPRPARSRVLDAIEDLGMILDLKARRSLSGSRQLDVSESESIG